MGLACREKFIMAVGEIHFVLAQLFLYPFSNYYECYELG